MDINTPYISDQVQREYLEASMHGELSYTLMNDFLSKYSLQNDLYALKGLLSALLKVELDTITAIEILNPIEPAFIISDKNCILDIKLELNHERIINIEIQSRHQDFWPERSITYLCRNFNHLREGESYSLIKPCIQIGILYNDLFEKDDPRYTGEFYSEYRLQNVKKHTDYSSKFSIRVLLLNHLENATEEEKADPNGLYFWAKLFRAKSWEELRMIAENNPRMESFVGTVRKLTEEEKVAQACEARRRYTQDVATYEYEIRTRQQMLEDTQGKLEDTQGKLEDTQGKLEDLQNQNDFLLKRIKELENELENK